LTEQIPKHVDIETLELPQLNNSILEKSGLSKRMDFEEYKKSKKLYQQKLASLQYELFKKKRSLIIAFEGWDAAGKGGDIYRLVENLNPRLYRVVPVGSPNGIEKAHIISGVFVTQSLKQVILQFLIGAGMAVFS
jgi:AMP-polyphosphate phosphotransferase